MRQQKFEACQRNLQEFESCRQNLAAALQQNEDSERVLQQVVSKLNENAQNMAGKDERCVSFVFGLNTIPVPQVVH